jgi:predicted SprT family Zn-dependent metalloprotease
MKVDLQEAETLSLSMMDEHGLIEAGWTFRFDKATSRLGATHFHKNEISLSRLMVQYAQHEDVVQTMLHEIAHALLPSSVMHGKEWKVLAASIGYVGERTATNPYVDAQLAGIADGPYARKIQKHKEEMEKARRKTRKPVHIPLPPVHIPGPPVTRHPIHGGKTKKVVVTVGSSIKLPGGDTGVIEKRSKTCWRVRSSTTGQLFAIPFAHVEILMAG